MVNVVDRPENRSAVDGLIAKAVPVNLTVILAVATALSASRTVKSIAVSAVTAFGVTVNDEPETFVVTGSTPPLLENTL